MPTQNDLHSRTLPNKIETNPKDDTSGDKPGRNDKRNSSTNDTGHKEDGLEIHEESEDISEMPIIDNGLAFRKKMGAPSGKKRTYLVEQPNVYFNGENGERKHNYDVNKQMNNVEMNNKGRGESKVEESKVRLKRRDSFKEFREKGMLPPLRTESNHVNNNLLPRPDGSRKTGTVRSENNKQGKSLKQNAETDSKRVMNNPTERLRRKSNQTDSNSLNKGANFKVNRPMGHQLQTVNKSKGQYPQLHKASAIKPEKVASTLYKPTAQSSTIPYGEKTDKDQIAPKPAFIAAHEHFRIREMRARAHVNGWDFRDYRKQTDPDYEEFRQAIQISQDRMSRGPNDQQSEGHMTSVTLPEVNNKTPRASQDNMPVTSSTKGSTKGGENQHITKESRTDKDCKKDTNQPYSQKEFNESRSEMKHFMGDKQPKGAVSNDDNPHLVHEINSNSLKDDILSETQPKPKFNLLPPDTLTPAGTPDFLRAQLQRNQSHITSSKSRPNSRDEAQGTEVPPTINVTDANNIKEDDADKKDKDPELSSKNTEGMSKKKPSKSRLSHHSTKSWLSSVVMETSSRPTSAPQDGVENKPGSSKSLHPDSGAPKRENSAPGSSANLRVPHTQRQTQKPKLLPRGFLLSPYDGDVKEPNVKPKGALKAKPADKTGKQYLKRNQRTKPRVTKDTKDRDVQRKTRLTLPKITDKRHSPNSVLSDAEDAAALSIQRSLRLFNM